MVIGNWLDQLADDQEMSDFLLLLYTIAGVDDTTGREGYVIEIENVLMPMSPTMSEAINSLLARRFKAIQREVRAAS
jgi:hypothetical protein